MRMIRKKPVAGVANESNGEDHEEKEEKNPLKGQRKGDGVPFFETLVSI